MAAALPADADAAATLRDQAAVLEKLLLDAYPPVDGEKLVESEVSCLLEDDGDLPAGTVFHRRVTDQATVLFFLPEVRVDLGAGRPWLVPAEPLRPAADEPSGIAGAPDAVNVALQVSGTLVWALPPPWGPIGAAGITLAELLMSGDGGQLNGIISGAVQQLEEFMNMRDVAAAATDVKGFLDWLSKQEDTLKICKADSSSAYISRELLPELSSVTKPGGSVYKALGTLEGLLKTDGALDIMMTAVAAYLLGLKAMVQFDAALASASAPGKDRPGDPAEFEAAQQLWLADYANFCTETAAWADTMRRHIGEAEQDRLGRMTAPYRYHYQTKRVVGTGASTTVMYDDHWGWTFRDDGNGDTDRTHFVEDRVEQKDCCSGYTRTEYYDAVERSHELFLHHLRDNLTRQYQPHSATIEAWRAANKQWSDHRPPEPPGTAPSIQMGVEDGLAQTGNWVKGNAVSYAVAQCNRGGNSALGPWSGWAEIGSSTCAVLSHFPSDPLKMTDTIWLYRRVKQADGRVLPQEIVGILDIPTDKFVDKRR